MWFGSGYVTKLETKPKVKKYRLANFGLFVHDTIFLKEARVYRSQVHRSHHRIQSCCYIDILQRYIDCLNTGMLLVDTWYSWTRRCYLHSRQHRYIDHQRSHNSCSDNETIHCCKRHSAWRSSALSEQSMKPSPLYLLQEFILCVCVRACVRACAYVLLCLVFIIAVHLGNEVIFNSLSPLTLQGAVILCNATQTIYVHLCQRSYRFEKWFSEMSSKLWWETRRLGRCRLER